MALSDYTNKVENGGATSQGRLSAEEFNSLVNEISRELGARPKGVRLNGRTFNSPDEDGLLQLGTIQHGEDNSRKVGYIAYTGSRINYYTEEGGEMLGGFDLTGTVYSIRLQASEQGTFYVLTSETEHRLTITPSTTYGQIGGQMTAFTEDYRYTIYVDSGTGTFRAVKSGECNAGGRFFEDVRRYLAIGDNRIRVLVEGELSGQTAALQFNVVVTTLTLSVSPSWWRAWTGGSYALDGIIFGGNLHKILYLRFDDDEQQTYTREFTSAQSFVSAPYTWVLTAGMFPRGGTGVHKAEIWMVGGSVETPHFTIWLMCVAPADTGTARLICMNNIAKTAMNYADARLFSFATYNATQATFTVTGTDGLQSFSVVAGETLSVTAQMRTDYQKKLEMDTEMTEGVSVMASASVTGGNTQTVTVPIDNSNSFPAVSGATFYMNAAQRANGQQNRTIVINQAQNAAVGQYAAQWTGFSWLTDGWATDMDGRKALAVLAGANLDIPTLRPLAAAETGSLTLEVKLRISSPADYDTPVLSIMSTDDYSATATSGLMIFPTKVLMLSTTERSVIPQSVGLAEDEVIHLVIVFQRHYGGGTGNLCQIYVNGIPNAMFSYSGAASFGNGTLRIGQQSADVYLYMMRLYEGRALQPQEVLANWLNTLGDSAELVRENVRLENQILDNGAISYDLCVQRGYNRMIIELEDETNAHLPRFGDAKNYTAMSSLTVEYADHPEWNFTMAHTPVGGQGTTSMQYFRWNFRWKNPRTTEWFYADGTTETGKGGYIAGREQHPKVEKITAKKNYASSQQGHKMGATAMYDDLMTELGLKSGLPDCARTAIYQYPVMGFQRFADGSTSFIGLYTIGPDKGDKNTFGYDTETYPRMLSLEGPNHAPLGTRFLHPWNGDVVYDPSEETLKFGGEEGWDVDVCSFETDSTADQANVQQLLEEEWKPAYDIVYFCSPYLRSLSEIGMTLAQLNSNPAAFRSQSTLIEGKKNEVVQFYNSSYTLIYYRNATGRYETLSGHNVVTYLQGYLSTSSPSRAQIVAARQAKFLAEAPNYWDLTACCFHDCYCELTGATDNHAKNSYPFKLATLAQGGRWSWRQDDLDTVMATDNNGQLTKSYSIEIGDRTGDGGEIFQGDSSALWALIGVVQQEQKKTMMGRIFRALQTMAGRLSLANTTLQDAAMSMFNYYFWQHSAKYFPATAYTEDAVWSYIEPWRLEPSRSYNGVYPLTQSLGDQLRAERRWVELRIIYLLSLYRLGGFQGDDSGGLGALQFTTIESHRFALKPAIDLYPSASLGGSTLPGSRTRAGEICTDIRSGASDNTTFYLKAADMYTSIGDLSGMVLSTRGASIEEGASFSLVGKRLRTVKIGDANAGNVRFNAGKLTIEGPAVEEIDARNVVSLKSEVSLLKCPRLRRALFAGSTARGIVLPAGARLTEVSLPQTVGTIFLHSLPLLSSLEVSNEALPTMQGLFFQNCPRLNPLPLLRRVLALNPNNRIFRYLTMIWEGDIEATGSDLDLLAELSDGTYGYISYQNGQMLNQAGKPDIEGVMTVAGNAYEDTVATLQNYFASLELHISGNLYIRFTDTVVEDICATSWGDGTGLTRAQAAAVLSVGGAFQNSQITNFMEFRFFSGIADTTSVSNHMDKNAAKLFAGSTLERVSMPPVAFQYGSPYLSPFHDVQSLVYVDWGDATVDITGELYSGCTSLAYYDGILPRGCTDAGASMFRQCTSLVKMIFPEGFRTVSGIGIFERCTSLKYVEFPSTMTQIELRLAFRYCTQGVYIVVKATTPPIINDTNYLEMDCVTYYYVPDRSVAAYRAAPGWSDLAIHPLSELPQEYRDMGTM